MNDKQHDYYTAGHEAGQDYTVDRIRLCSGFGQYHTNEPDPAKPEKILTAYASVTFSEIKALVDNPQQVDKDRGQWLIASTYPSRNFKEQEKNGEYWMLWADLDKNPPPLETIGDAIEPVLDDCDFELYNSRSATEENQKARLIVFLDKPLSFWDWTLAQQTLNDKLAALGIIPDRANERAAQLCYLPNKGAFYESDVKRNGQYFDPLQVWADEIAEKRQKIEAGREALEAAKRLAIEQRESLRYSDKRNGLIDAFNRVYTCEEILVNYGYDQRGNAFRHPNSQSGSYSGSINPETGRYRTFSPNDPLYVEGDKSGHNAFSVFQVLQHNRDQKAALRDAGDNIIKIGSESWNKVKRRIHEQEKAKKGSEPPRDEQQTNDSGTASDHNEDEIEIDEPTDDSLSDYPDELLHLPGILGELQEFIYNRMTYPSMETAGFAAIATMTAFVQTNLTIDSRDGLGFNEYYLTLAATGFGKEDIRKPLIILDDSAKTLSQSVRLHYAAPASKQGLHKLLEGNRSAYFVADEYAEWLRLTHTDVGKQDTLGYLMQLYSRANGTIEPGHAVSGQYTTVKNPRVSILATSTSEAMFDTMTKQQAESGAYNRFVIFAGDTVLPAKRYEGLVYDPSDELVEKIQWLKSLPEQKVTFRPEAFETYKKLDSELAEPIKRKDKVLGGRLGEQAIKMAGLFALAHKRLEMIPSDLEAAFNIRIGLYHRAAALVKQEGNLEGLHETTAAVDQLKNACKGKTVYKSKLSSLSRKYKSLSVRDQGAVLQSLINNGYAQNVENKPKMLRFL